MQQKYKGSYYKGNNIGLKQYRLLAKQKGGNIISKNKSSYFGITILFICFIGLLCFFYFNKKECEKKQRDKIEDTVELIQNVAKYNLETDIAKTQSTHAARNASIAHRNPAKVREITMEKHKAIALENKRRTDYLAQQYALDAGEVSLIDNNLRQSHQQFYKPPQPVSEQSQLLLPIDSSRQEQTQMMYDIQFNLPDERKPYQTINSPFVHPQETTRPLMSQPEAMNNSLEVDNKQEIYMQNVPSNVFNPGFFNVEESYESPFLVNATGVTKYGNPCVNNSNINNSTDPKVKGGYGYNDYYYV